MWTKGYLFYTLSSSAVVFYLVPIVLALAIRSSSTCGVPGWLSRLSVGLLISAQVMISWFVSLSPESGSVLGEEPG